MFNSVDLYLGAFLILCGFSLSLLNLQRVIKKNKFSSILLSENILLSCIGVAFIARAVYHSNVQNVQMFQMDERAPIVHDSKQCTIWSAIASYGPLVVSFVNSFLSLVIDNYLHYNILQDIKEKEDENTVRDIEEGSVHGRRFEVKKVFAFWKRYLSQIIIGLQWVVPVLISIFMYPMGVNEKIVTMSEARSDTCMAMINLSNETCNDDENLYNDIAFELQKQISSNDYLEAHENNVDETYRNKSKEIDFVLKNLYGLINDVQNESFTSVNVTSPSIFRKPKFNSKCMKVCYVENSKLLLYMFALAVVSYFVPITISTVILTKIHMMDTKRVNEKTYAIRELLYNVLFWTPVMLDTFLSLILCTYSTDGMKTSLLNTIANVYQAVKNFMNTKYFKDNSITPI